MNEYDPNAPRFSSPGGQNTQPAADGANGYHYNPSNSSNQGQNLVPPMARKAGRVNLIFGGIFLFIMAFLSGILFTVVMQNNSFQGTPLELVQRPVLAISNIPADAHKEWLAFQQSFSLIEKYYYQHDKVNQKEMYYAAGEAAITAVGDRFTAYNRPAQAEANRNFITGKFVGIGITSEIKDGKYLVKRLLDNSPAQKAGIKEGDILTAINSEALPPTLIDYGPVTDKLRGEVGTKIKVTFVRPSDNNKATEYELIRAELINPSVDVQMLPGNIVYIEMTRVFGENTMKEFDEKVGAAAKTNPAGYILDLRGNGGGSTETARQLLGRFLEGGVAYYEDIPYQNVTMRAAEVLSNAQVKLFDKPLAVLVNGGSASASEITAGALQDRQRAALIGEKTFGKGSAQLVFPLIGNSALRVTTEHWFTPNKVNVGDIKGIVPDLAITPTEAQKKANQDPQLERAVQYIKDKMQG